MTKYVHFFDVGFKSKKDTIFERFTFDFIEEKNVCLIGENGVGKSLLLKAVAGLVPYEGEILKSDKCSVLFQNQISSNGNIYEYLHFSSLSFEVQKIITSFLKLNSLNYKVKDLNEKFRLKVLLLEQILKKTCFLFVDDIFGCFTLDEKQEFLHLLKKFHITFFYVTSNIEDVLLFPYLIVMGKNGILMEGKTLSLLKEEKIMKRLGFSLPFLVDLSLQLKSYNLLDEIFDDERKLTDAIWK